MRKRNQRSVEMRREAVYTKADKSERPRKGGKTIVKKTLGALIAERRRQKGMTQQELAEKMRVTDKAVSKWEREVSHS